MARVGYLAGERDVIAGATTSTRCACCHARAEGALCGDCRPRLLHNCGKCTDHCTCAERMKCPACQRTV